VHSSLSTPRTKADARLKPSRSVGPLEPFALRHESRRSAEAFALRWSTRAFALRHESRRSAEAFALRWSTRAFALRPESRRSAEAFALCSSTRAFPLRARKQTLG